MNHLLSIESLSGAEINAIIDAAVTLKAERGNHTVQPLAGQCWAMIFSKSSTRTRVSFEVGVRELGGSVMFLSSNDIQLGRGEPIKDTARVMGRMLHGAIIRTFAQQDVEDFAQYSGIPTINALTDDEHPCQILADLLTMRELLGGWEDKRVAFFGDGACNMGRSWAWAAARLGFELAVAAPDGYQLDDEFMAQLPEGAKVTRTDDPKIAAEGADVLYTDTWVSMGRENEEAKRLVELKPFQVNEALLDLANEGVIVQHCLPAYRDYEITERVLESHADQIFQQAENRLHAQKAVLALLAAGQ
ncbi:MAG: ornithine carbamoyltransferase [Verrucomicrobiae bacterium]|nr:ornithine carbamoyltransferase [Verrucomicrobiae bacterium]